MSPLPGYKEPENRMENSEKDIVIALKDSYSLLQKKETRYRLALEAVNEGLWDWNPKTGEVFFTPRYYTMLGYAPNELPPSFETWRNLLHPQDMEKSVKEVTDYLEGRIPNYEIEFRLRCKSGQWKWILGRGEILERDEHGKPLRIIGTHLDIDNRKREEARIRHLNGVLQAIRDAGQLILREKDRRKMIQGVCDILLRSCKYEDVFIVLLSPLGRIDTWAHSRIQSPCSPFAEMLKENRLSPCAKKARILGRPVCISHPGENCRDCCMICCPLKGYTLAMPLRYGEKDYGILSFSLPESAEPEEFEQNLVANVAGDIAFCLYSLELEEQRRQVETDLRKYEIIVSTVRDPMFFMDRNYVIQSANAAFLDFFKTTKGKVIGHTLKELVGEDFFSEHFKTHIDWCFLGHEAHYQDRIPGQNGAKYLDIVFYPYTEPNGTVSGLIMNSRDITGFKQIENSLVERTYELGERVKELNCLIGISVLMEKPGISPEEIFSGIISMLCSALQYSDLGCVRIGLHDGRIFASPRFEPSPWKIENDILAHGKWYGRIEIFYRENLSFLTEEKLLLHSIAERLGKVLERIRQDAALQESEKRFRDLVENSPMGISIVSNHEVIYENPEQKRLGLFNPPEPFPNPDRLFPDDVSKVLEMYHNVTNQIKSTAATDFRFYPLRSDLSRRELIWVNCRMSGIRYEGEPAVLINMIDVTRSRETEKLLNIRDKMSSLGRVAAGIAHEIRNPLSGINIYLDTLNRMADTSLGLGTVNVDDPEKFKNIIERIQSASYKIESIIKRVMDFSKPSEPQLARIDIREPIKEAVHLIEVTLRKSGIELRRILPGTPIICRADSQLIEQVILNLVNNAAEALRHQEAGPKIIELRMLKRKHTVCIGVSDSGPGIPYEAMKNIFDPFYSTKSYGTGIGLSLCHRIITDHGGTFDVNTSQWGGAEFSFKLPLEK